MFSTTDLRDLVTQVGALAVAESDRERIDQLAALESLRNAAWAAQVRITVAFGESQVQQQRQQGVPEARATRGVTEQVALARRISPAVAAREIETARALVEDLPATLRALQAGDLGVAQAAAIARETALLAPADRAAIDTELAASSEGQATRQVEARARRRVREIDPDAARRAAEAAEAARRVIVRPRPDCTSELTAHLPAAAGTAIRQALDEHARSLHAAGDSRTLDQLRADTLIERLTGQQTADRVPVSVALVMTDRALLAEDPTGEPEAHLDGYGPVPAWLARDLVTRLPETDTVALRRLFTDPTTGGVSGIDSRQRCFTGALRTAIRVRDQVCRTPYCGAPITQIDHVTPRAAGGPTSLANGQGLCQRCNLAKQAAGWSTRPGDSAPGDGAEYSGPIGPGSTVRITTPTGHTYDSTPPPGPGRADPVTEPTREHPADLGGPPRAGHGVDPPGRST